MLMRIACSCLWASYPPEATDWIYIARGPTDMARERPDSHVLIEYLFLPTHFKAQCADDVVFSMTLQFPPELGNATRLRLPAVGLV